MGDPMKLVKIVRQKHGIDSCESQLVIKRHFSCFSQLHTFPYNSGYFHNSTCKGSPIASTHLLLVVGELDWKSAIAVINFEPTAMCQNSGLFSTGYCGKETGVGDGVEGSTTKSHVLFRPLVADLQNFNIHRHYGSPIIILKIGINSNITISIIIAIDNCVFK